MLISITSISCDDSIAVVLAYAIFANDYPGTLQFLSGTVDTLYVLY